MTRDHGKQIKDDKLYETLRDKGYSKSKSAAIANAEANPDLHPSRKGGKAGKLENRSREELMQQARDLGIAGRSRMSKDELVKALRKGS